MTWQVKAEAPSSSLLFLIRLYWYNILSIPSFLSARCFEAMSPWHEGRNISQSPRRSIYSLTCGSQEILNGAGLAAERLPLSNYVTASREGELQLDDPFMVPNIPFLFILNLFVQSSPLMLAAPSSPRHWQRGKKHKREASSRKKEKKRKRVNS